MSEVANGAQQTDASLPFLECMLMGLGDAQEENAKSTPILESSAMDEAATDVPDLSINMPDLDADNELDDSFPSGCCTPNIENINEDPYEEEESSSESCDSPPPPRRGGEARRPVAVVLPQSPKPSTNRFGFEIVPPSAVKVGCQRRTEEEKVRNYNKAPVPACKKFLKDLDPIVNSPLYQLSRFKFSKTRVERCVRESREYAPVSDAVMEVHRRFRRYSDPSAYSAQDYENHLKEGRAMDEGMRAAAALFPEMRKWLVWKGKYKEQWPQEDDARIMFPVKDSVIVVRVMEVVGRHATVVPAGIYEEVASRAKTYVDRNWPLPPIPDDYNEFGMVLYMKESDTIDEYDYLRGWLFDYTKDGLLAVLLMDERRIIFTPRNFLCKCPEDIVMFAPPLCVSALFDRQVTERELQLLYIGCAAQCRVIDDKAGSEGGGSLKLQLINIDTQGRSLDGLFCSLECGGACQHHHG